MRLSGRLVVPLIFMVTTLISWLGPRPEATLPEPVTADLVRRYHDGRLEERQGLRILRLTGTPYDMGYQHGVLLRHEIRAGLQDQVFERLMLQGQVSHLLLLHHARRLETYLPSEYRDEMRGLADGAGLSYSDVLLLNSYHDLICEPTPRRGLQELFFSLYPLFIPQMGPRAVLSSAPATVERDSTGNALCHPVGGTFAIFGQGTEDRKLLQGLDFASPAPYLQDLLLILYRPDVGNTFVAVGWPGMVGVTMGLNEERISVAGLPSPSQDASLDGIPLPFLLREVLQYAGDIRTALRLIASAERTTGYNVVIGDGKPADAQALEFSAHQYAIFEADNDLVVRTNHYLDPSLSETQLVSSGGDNESSRARLEELSHLLSSGFGHMDSSSAMNLLKQGHDADRGDYSTGDQERVLGVLIASSDLEVSVVLHPEGRAASLGVKLDEEL
ncbi:MAG: hypothetical protein CEE40_02785 [Chloroflexi bacterium B3_Chlor]|nr:MAG: hypothetical protein CEE40_02785 [Chloroflexi bacterium B3_Chlor]